MKKLSLLFPLSFTLIISSCSTTRAPSVNFLEIRSDYNGKSQVKELDNNSLFVPNRTKPKQVDIYIHPHETVHGDYFRGGYIRSIVQGGQWELTENQAPKEIKVKETQKKDKKKYEVKEVHPHLRNHHFMEHAGRHR